MKTRTTVVIAAAFAVLVSSALIASTSFADRRGPGWHGGAESPLAFQEHRGPGFAPGMPHGPHSHHSWPGDTERLLEDFDSNKDGKLTQAEVDQTRRDRFAQFDTDKDGKLTLQEYQALWLDAMRRHLVDRFQGLDDDGDAAVTVEEFIAPFSKVVHRLDRNNDSEITRDEFRRR
jgi:hypothetical protein